MIPDVCNNSANYFVSNKLLFGSGSSAGDCDVSVKDFVIYVCMKKKKNDFIFGCCF